MEDCLRVAMQAPIGSNGLYPHFVMVTDPAKRAAVAGFYKQAWDAYLPLPFSAANLHFEDPVHEAQQPRVTSSAAYLAEHMAEVPALVIPCITPRVDGMPWGVPVIGVLRTVFDTGDVPLEVQDTAPGDRHEFRCEVSMDGDSGRDAASGPLRVGACLSLSGRYARFGSQAARALQAWAALDGDAGLVIRDDRSDPEMLQALLPEVAAGCDVLLGPYSTQLARAAGKMAAAAGWLVWNHGGSGDDVQAACPGHAVSLLTPASRYAERFIRDVVGGTGLELWIGHGKGSFGRQVADGAQKIAERAGARTRRLGNGDSWPCPPGPWALVSAGTFEDDVQAVNRARRQRHPPRLIFSVAAGVHEFAAEVDDPEGIYGAGQWFPGNATRAELGPPEDAFLAAYATVTDQPVDYPGVQAAAAAVIAAYCARQARSTARGQLWAQAAALDTATLFGGFRIDPVTGVQVKHEAALVRWTSGGLTPA